ncbi:MAG: hypothetical protein CMA65_01315 [Euryarchaeota archaeon]|nr:hypothetical protein [Euryarchaeota archaeon]
MHEIGQNSVPTSEGDTEMFASLRLAEPSERVKITLDERMLAIKGRRGSDINLRVGAIDSVQHHSSNLVPNWLLMMGFVSIYVGWRLLVIPLHKWSFMLLGAAAIFARFFTRQPTVTIQTAANDTHVLYGNEHVLTHLTFMVNKLLKGRSLAHARIAWNAVDQTAGIYEDGIIPAPQLPVVINTPTPINMFLASLGEEIEEEDLVAEEDTEPEWMPTHAPQPTGPSILPSFLTTYHSEQAMAHANTYPPDHRPAPVYLPILEPHSSPPMHQNLNSDHEPTPVPQQFLPSFVGATEVHIPQRETEPVTEEEGIVLDADLMDEFEELEIEVAQYIPEPTQQQSQYIGLRRNEPVLQPRKARDPESAPLRPRQRQHPHQTTSQQPRGLFAHIRKIAREFLSSAKGPSRPSPYGTSSTSSAMREHAQNAQEQQTGEILRSLSTENGGAFDPAEMERIQGRVGTMLATVDELDAELQPSNLDDISFADLMPSAHEETTKVRRLDD